MYQNTPVSGLDEDSGLAGDVALFEAVESGLADYRCRFWQATRPIVVVGRNRPLLQDVRLDACRADAVPVVRRSSGGGTVVLGDGCLNYAVALSLVSRPELQEIAGSFRVILGAIAKALDIPGLTVSGTDLTIRSRKVSGNAQRRGRRAVLHHGTLLFAFDVALAARYLTEPSRQPAYRAGRSHADFMTNLPLPVERIQAAVAHALRALAPPRPVAEPRHWRTPATHA
jgi:lipoate-protein ligase A